MDVSTMHSIAMLSGAFANIVFSILFLCQFKRINRIENKLWIAEQNVKICNANFDIMSKFPAGYVANLHKCDSLNWFEEKHNDELDSDKH